MKVSDSEWQYRIDPETPTKFDTVIWYTFTTVEDERFKNLYAQEIILSGIRTIDRNLTNREVFALMLPVVVEIRSQRSQDGGIVESAGIRR